jgi:TolB-like protein/Tfp pilus assembly protein PilF
VAALAVSLPLFWSRSKSQGRESEPSIAVLPFVNMSPDKENEYLGDGITEELCTALTQLKGLRVPARTSSFAFKGKTEDVRKIGEQLNVGTVLEGSVSKAGNKLRVSAQLINVANGFHLWAANYDREMTDILEIRSDISRRVVDALKIQLGVSETERLTKKPTEMTEAYNSYLLGRYELNKFTEAGFTNAVAHFKRAIALDPSFAIATAGLAEAYNMLGYWNYLPPKEAFPEAKKAAEQALELDPALAEAHTALAYSRFQYEWKFEEAEMEFKEAIRLNPGSVDARLGFCEYLFDLGRAQDAHEQLERAKELDPLSVRVSFCFAAESFFERDFDRAAERLQTTISMDPNNAFAYDLLEAVLWRQNTPVEAFEASEKTNALEGIFSQQEMADMRKAYEVSGYSGYLRKENELRQQHLAQGKYESPLIIALTYARAGANSEALDWLEKAAEERTPWLPELKIDPAWDGVRSDPRFIAVLKKIGLESKPSIAVLPFENLSEEKSNAYFADGIQDEILIRLSKIADLKVISRTSTQKYKSAPPNLREIARQLGVSNILEGSVQKATDQVRISVQLINALNDSHLWAETYDRKLIDMFQVESDVAQKIAGALEARLTGKEKAAINSRGTDNPQAYEAYLHAVALRTSQSTEEQQRYVDFCRQAVELDPNYAQAWADLAVAEANKYFFPEHTIAQKERARVAAETALRLAPDLADAQAAMGLYYYCLRDYERALAKLEGARQLAPNDWKVISSIALIKRRQGKMEEAIALLKEAAQLDPLNEDVWVKLAGSYAGIRKFDEARSTFDRALKIVPNNAEILSQKAGSYLAAGDLATAWRIMKDLKVSTNNRSFGTYIAILVFQRRFDDAIAFVSSAIEQGKEVSPTFLAIAHAELGQLNLVKGRQAQAQPLFVQAESELKQLQGRDEEILVSDTLMTVEAHLGRHDEVERLAEANLQLLRQDQWQLPFEEETIARAYMILGDVDRALPLLSHALEVPCVLPLTPKTIYK